MKIKRAQSLIGLLTVLCLTVLFQNCSGGASNSSELSSLRTVSCWATLQNPVDFRLIAVGNANIHLTGMNTATPGLQANNAVLTCTSGNISSLTSYNVIKGYLTGLSICVGDLGNADQITTDVGSNNRADDASVKPHGATYTQLKIALDQMISEANAAGFCN